MTINLKNSKPSAIIFDWDNTLANTWPLIEKAMHDMLKNIIWKILLMNIGKELLACQCATPSFTI